MNFPTIITAFLAALTIPAFAAPAKNVVIFLVDDLGYKDLGCYGSDYYETPHIDQLAKEGLRFTDAYATCAVCTPTRASMLTGKYHNAPDRVARIGKIRDILRRLPETIPHTGFVESTGCSPAARPKVHFNRESYDLLGKRYAAVYADINKDTP